MLMESNIYYKNNNFSHIYSQSQYNSNTTGLFTALDESKMLYEKVKAKKKQGPSKGDEQEKGIYPKRH